MLAFWHPSDSTRGIFSGTASEGNRLLTFKNGTPSLPSQGKQDGGFLNPGSIFLASGFSDLQKKFSNFQLMTTAIDVFVCIPSINSDGSNH